MNKLLISSLVTLVAFTYSPAQANDAAKAETAECASFLDHKVRKLNATNEIDLCELTAGKATLIINTASDCGYTPQFEGLEALHKNIKIRA